MGEQQAKLATSPGRMGEQQAKLATSPGGLNPTDSLGLNLGPEPDGLLWVKKEKGSDDRAADRNDRTDEETDHPFEE